MATIYEEREASIALRYANSRSQRAGTNTQPHTCVQRPGRLGGSPAYAGRKGASHAKIESSHTINSNKETPNT